MLEDLIDDLENTLIELEQKFKNVNSELKKRIDRSNYTHRDVIKHLGISPPTYYKRRNSNFATIDELKKIALLTRSEN